MKEADIRWSTHAVEMCIERDIYGGRVVQAILKADPKPSDGTVKIVIGTTAIVFDAINRVVVTVMHKRITFEEMSGIMSRRAKWKAEREEAIEAVKEAARIERNNSASIQARQKKKKYDRMLKRSKRRTGRPKGYK